MGRRWAEASTSACAQPRPHWAQSHVHQPVMHPLSLPAWPCHRARRALQGVRGAALCWALGLARLLSTTALGYQAHVGEYGVHWNFFCTVAVVALLGASVRVAPARLPLLALAVTACHQALLSLGEAAVLHARRPCCGCGWGLHEDLTAHHAVHAPMQLRSPLSAGHPSH